MPVKYKIENSESGRSAKVNPMQIQLISNSQYLPHFDDYSSLTRCQNTYWKYF